MKSKYILEEIIQNTLSLEDTLKVYCISFRFIVLSIQLFHSEVVAEPHQMGSVLVPDFRILKVEYFFFKKTWFP